MAVLAALGLMLAACSPEGEQTDARRIVFSPQPGGATAPPTATGDAGSATNTPDGGTATADTGATGTSGETPAPVQTRREGPVQAVALTAAGNHLEADLGRVTPQQPAPGSECDVSPEGYQMIQCEIVRGTGGAFAVWAGQEQQSRGLRVQVHRHDPGSGSFVLVAQSLLTRDFRELVLRVGESGGERFALIEYELDGQGNLHDFDVVTFASGQDAPGPVASLHRLVSPRVTIDSGVHIEALNYGDGAELCCPRYKDVMRLFLDPGSGWVAHVQTVPFDEG